MPKFNSLPNYILIQNKTDYISSESLRDYINLFNLECNHVIAYKFDIDCAPIAMIIKYKGHAHKEKALRSKRW